MVSYSSNFLFQSHFHKYFGQQVHAISGCNVKYRKGLPLVDFNVVMMAKVRILDQVRLSIKQKLPNFSEVKKGKLKLYPTG